MTPPTKPCNLAHEVFLSHCVEMKWVKRIAQICNVMRKIVQLGPNLPKALLAGQRKTGQLAVNIQEALAKILCFMDCFRSQEAAAVVQNADEGRQSNKQACA